MKTKVGVLGMRVYEGSNPIADAAKQSDLASSRQHYRSQPSQQRIATPCVMKSLSEAQMRYQPASDTTLDSGYKSFIMSASSAKIVTLNVSILLLFLRRALVRRRSVFRLCASWPLDSVGFLYRPYSCFHGLLSQARPDRIPVRHNTE